MGVPEEPTTPGVLRLLSAGAAGAILMALGPGPLRTKELTQRVPGYSPRTIYRYASKLAELGIVERREEPGVPSKVVHSLADPCGVDLHALVDAYADASLTRLPGGEVSAHAWGSLGLLADLWESGILEELNSGPCSTTELARAIRGLSYHQISRRADLFAIGGFLGETSEGRRRRYALTEQARRAMALIAGIGRWRRRYVVSRGEAGLTAGEVTAMLRTALPLVALRGHAGKSLKIDVHPGRREARQAADVVWANIDSDGKVMPSSEPIPEVDGWAYGKAPALVDAVVDGSADGVRIDGDDLLITSCLTILHASLWGKPV